MGAAQTLPRLTKTDLLTSVLCVVVFWLGVLGRRSETLSLLILAIPFGSRNVAGSSTSFLLPLTVAAALGSISTCARAWSDPQPGSGCGCTSALQATDYGLNRTAIWDWLILLFVGCHAASLLSYALRPFPREITLLEPSPVVSMLQLVGAMTGGFLLYRLMLRQVGAPADVLCLIGWFVGTLVVLAVVVAASDLLQIPLPDFFLPWVTIGLPDGTWTTVRGGLRSSMPFAGFHGFVENFGEYLVIVFALAYALSTAPKAFRGQRCLGVTGMALALLFAVPSACKAVPILLVLFWLTQIGLGRGRERRRLGWAAALVILGLVAGWPLLARTPLGLRLSVLLERAYTVWRGRMGSHTIPILLGREGVERLWSDVIPVAGLFGVGPVIVHAFQGSVLPYHNLYYQVWLDYGAVGLAALLLLLITTLRRAASLRQAADPIVARMGDILLGLLPLLLLEQLKVSALRLASGVYTGWYLFALITVLERQTRLGELPRACHPGRRTFGPRYDTPRRPFCGRGNRIRHIG
jgi:hypothetical protein